MTDVGDDDLGAVLTDARRLGMLGDRPIVDVIEHARAFVAALDGVSGRVADLGSGGGVPGLVIALDRPDLEVVLVDRREKRTDFLSRVVIRLDLVDRVEVRCVDVADLVQTEAGRFDGVVARGFGPPEPTLRAGLSLATTAGRVVISEPPAADRWPVALLDALAVSRHRHGPVAVFTRR